MSSDLFLFDGSFFRHPSSDMVSSELDLQFLSDPLFPFEDSLSDIILQANSEESIKHFPTDPSPLTTITNPFSHPPPSQELNNLSLGSTTTQLESLPISSISANGLTDFSVLDSLGVESEESYAGFDSYAHEPSLLQPETVVMQRSFSSQSLDRKPGFFFKPHFNSLVEGSIFQTQVMGSPENIECIGPMRRVCSTGDLQRIKTRELSHGLSSSPLASENSFMEESSCKIRRYSAEERKQRIQRYRSKRAQRNFNKTIKYACRKTLADSRPRVRGRFARNDETGEIPKVTGLNREEEDEDEIWGFGFQEDEDEALIRGRRFLLNSSGQTYKF